jgi:hypothetical protein
MCRKASLWILMSSASVLLMIDAVRLPDSCKTLQGCAASVVLAEASSTEHYLQQCHLAEGARSMKRIHTPRSPWTDTWRRLLHYVYIHCTLDKHKKVLAGISLGEYGLVWLELQELTVATYRCQLRVRIRLQELALDNCSMDVFDVPLSANPTRHPQRSRQLRQSLPLSACRQQFIVNFVSSQPAAEEDRPRRQRCRGRRPQHRCERADARDVERADLENRMMIRCAAGAEGARRA